MDSAGRCFDAMGWDGREEYFVSEMRVGEEYG